MYSILGILIIGIILGFIFRKREKLIKLSDKLLMWSIYLLLFLLGISIGTNDDIIRNFPTIGLKALILTFAGVLGSCLVSFLIYKIYFVEKENDEK